jgi:hypothetical protein
MTTPVAGSGEQARAHAADEGQPPWELEPDSSGDGIVTYRLKSWSHFHDLLDQVVFGDATLRATRYIWRGQRQDNWSLSSSLDRLFDRLGLLATLEPRELERRASEHLETFRYASRGRRGSNPQTLTVNEWWALGQHYGLATPLLDWSRSPFAAAYFAFEEAEPCATAYRAVFALNQRAVLAKNFEIDNGPSIERGRIPVVEFVDPLSDENPRLVSQGGLLTRAPIGMPIEHWVAQAFEGQSVSALLRIKIPDHDRATALRSLNRMNINHLSLFPDLNGASRYTNLKFELGE